MESQQILENFESLWFFATVFSDRSPLPAVGKLQNPTQNDAVEAIVVEIATPIFQNQQILENFESLWFFATVFSDRSPPAAVGKLQNPTQNDAVEAIVVEIATPIFQNQQNVDERRKEDCNVSEMKTEEKRKSRIRRRSRRKIVGEMDLSCAVKEICECWLVEERIGNGNYYQMKKKKKKMMASFEDNMAMKEHIRSWAYAVACAVR